MVKWFAFFLVACLLLSAAVAEASFSDMVIFGDSLTDTGNVYIYTSYTTPASPPHYQGRFSNGPVWVEHFAVGLGLLPPIPALAGGNNFAAGGAQTGDAELNDLYNQVTLYMNSGATPAADELFVLWAGANDLIHNHSIDVSVPVANLSGYITTLAAAGAENFLVPNLPALGQIPRYYDTTSETLMDNLTIAFNTELEAELDSLESALSITIYRLDVFDIVQEVTTNPATYGFTNVTEEAYNGTTVVPNPDEYLYWDDMHPTAVAHALLGEFAVSAVPEPSFMIMLIGLLALPAALRLRKA